MTFQEIKGIANTFLVALGQRFDKLEMVILNRGKNDKVAEAFEDAAGQMTRLAALMMTKVNKEDGIKKDDKGEKIMAENALVLKTIASNLADYSAELKRSSAGDYLENMTEELKVSLSGMATTLQALKIEAPMVSIPGFENLSITLASIEKHMKTISDKAILVSLEQIIKVIREIPRSFPKSIKFDGDQFRELVATIRASGKGGSAGGSASGGGALGMAPTVVGSIRSGRAVISVTNTAVQLGTGASRYVFVTASPLNSDLVVIGDSAVIYNQATRTGKIMYAGDSITIEIDQLSKLYFNGTSGDAVTFTVTK